MGLLSKFEGKMEDTLEGAADRMVKSPISPVQIAKKAEKQMRREKMVGAGKQYAPTLYTVLVNPDDDERLFGYYPTLAGEIETYLAAKAAEDGLMLDGQPLVRFIVDDGLRHGKFEVVAEAVAAPLVAQLRREEMEHYGLTSGNEPGYGGYPHNEGIPDSNGYNAYGNDYGEIDGSGYGNNNYDYNDYAEGGYGEGNYANGYDNAYGSDNYADYDDAGSYGMGEPAAQGNMHATPPAPMRLTDTTNNRTYPLEGQRLVIGRESSCDIVFPDINISRVHAEICLNPQGIWVLTDLDSTNGTFVNGRGVSSHPLRTGDRITIGMTNLVVDQTFGQNFDQAPHRAFDQAFDRAPEQPFDQAYYQA